MLLSFSFSNFGPFESKQTISFRAIKNIKSHNGSLIDNLVLPITCFYGPNGGGKTTILNALSYLLEILGFSTLFSITPPYEFIINSINQNDLSKPSDFELFFLIDKTIYHYFISLKRNENNAIEIINEFLYLQKGDSKNSKQKCIFNLKENSICISELNSKKIDDLSYLKVQPFLKFISGLIKSNEHINLLKEQVSKIFTFDSSVVLARPWLQRKYMEENKKDFLKYFKDLNFNILDFEFGPINSFTQQQDFNSLVLKKETNKVEPSFYNIGIESKGTIKIISMLSNIHYSLKHGYILVVDELDASLHTSLLEYIIKLFTSKATNKKGAQLIFNSHDMNTLNSSVFRSDEIYFSSLDKIHNGQIARLSDFKVRDHNSYSKLYLKGSFGADPYINYSMEQFNEE